MGAVIIVPVNGRLLAPWKSAVIEGDERDRLVGRELALLLLLLLKRRRGRLTMARGRMKVILYDRREGRAPVGMKSRRLLLRKRKRMIRMSQMREGPLEGGRRKV